MPGGKAFELSGAMPACLPPFSDDLKIDELKLKRIRDVFIAAGLLDYGAKRAA